VHYQGLTFAAELVGEKSVDVAGPGMWHDHEFLFSLGWREDSLGMTLDPDKTVIDYVAARPEYARVQDNSGQSLDYEVLRPTRRASEHVSKG
jgi:hypothetical protein